MPPLHYTLNEDDVLGAQRAFLRVGMRWGRMLLVILAIFAVLGTALLVDGRPLAASDLTPFLGAAAAALVVPPWLYWYMPRRAVALFRQQKAAAFPVTLDWDANAITFAAETGCHRLTWPLFRAWMDAPETLALFQSDQLFHPIPKRVLTANDVAAITGHLRAAGVPERRRWRRWRRDRGAGT